MTGGGGGEPRLEPVEVQSSETVARRGVRRVTWLVRKGSAWVPAAEWPGARVESLDAGQGTIWETRIELQLPPGTLLTRVESRPGMRVRRDPLAYLERGARASPRAVLRLYFRVARGGRLVRAAPGGAAPKSAAR